MTESKTDLKGQSTMTDRKAVAGLFHDRDSAENAYNSLHQRGYTKDDINVVMSEDTRKKHFGEHTTKSELGTKAAEGAGTGSAIGGAIGAVVGIIAAIGTSVIIPGGFIIAGPLAVGLAGAGAGGITGGILGALVGYGIPKEHAAQYEKEVKDGKILLSVKPKNTSDEEYFQKDWSKPTLEGANKY